MDRRTTSELEFDRAFGIWRGTLDEIHRCERTLRQLRVKEEEQRGEMLALRDKRVKELAA